MSLLPDDVYRTADITLTVLKATAVAVSAAPGLPGREVIRVGGAVYDCEQVCVAVVAVNPGLPESEAPMAAIYPCGPVWSATMELSITRTASEVAQGKRGDQAPDPVKIDADLYLASWDLAVLTQTAESLGARIQGNLTVSALAPGPEGGLFSSVLTVIVPVDPDSLSA